MLSMQITIYSLVVPVEDSKNVAAQENTFSLFVESRAIPCYSGQYYTYISAYVKHLDGTMKVQGFASDSSTLDCSVA